MNSARERPLRYGFLGRSPYRQALGLQQRLRREVRRGGDDALILLEHPHVYTLGRSAGRDDVLLSESVLRGRGITVEKCDRGGQVTYHGPGQLVGYPVLDLNPDRRDVRRYVRDLQRVLVETLCELGVDAEGRMEQPEIGVWVGRRKIASIGVHLSRWITTHGFALNLSTDLDYFRGIVPCGLQGVEMTSVESLTGRRFGLEDVAALCAGIFAEVFDRRLVGLAGSRGREPRAAATRAPSSTVSRKVDSAG